VRVSVIAVGVVYKTQWGVFGDGLATKVLHIKKGEGKKLNDDVQLATKEF
jgi:hypothetical protein